MRTAQELLKAERSALFMVDAGRDELWTTVAEGEKEIRLPLKKGIAGKLENIFC
jgi:hypothetical protein